MKQGNNINRLRTAIAVAVFSAICPGCVITSSPAPLTVEPPQVPEEALKQCADIDTLRIWCFEKGNPWPIERRLGELMPDANKDANLLRWGWNNRDRLDWASETVGRRFADMIWKVGNELPQTMLRELSEQGPTSRIRGEALRHLADPAAVLAHAASSDPWILYGVAANAATHASDVERYARHTEALVRKGAAANPNLKGAALDALAYDKDGDVRENVARRSDDLSEKALLRLSRDKRQWIKFMLAYTSNPKVLAVLSRDSDSMIREAVANNEDTPASILERLLNDKEGLIADAAAVNPGTPRKAIMEKVRRGDCWSRQTLAMNRNLPAPIASILADDDEPRVRQALAKNPATGTDLLLRMATRYDPKSKMLNPDRGYYHDYAAQSEIDVLSAIASRTDDPEVLLALIERNIGSVLNKPNVPRKVIAYAAGVSAKHEKKFEDGLSAVAAATDDSDLLVLLARSKSGRVLRSVLSNRRVTPDVLQTIARNNSAPAQARFEAMERLGELKPLPAVSLAKAPEEKSQPATGWRDSSRQAVRPPSSSHAPAVSAPLAASDDMHAPYEIVTEKPYENGKIVFLVTILDPSLAPFQIESNVRPKLAEEVRNMFLTEHAGLSAGKVKTHLVVEYGSNRKVRFTACAFSMEPVLEGYRYDSASRRLRISARLSDGVSVETAQDWARDTAFGIASDKNILLAAGGNPPPGASLVSLEESFKDGILTAEYQVVE